MAITTVKTIIEMPLNKRGDTLCVRLVNTGKAEMIDVRKFYTDDADELQPTSKGVMLAPEVWAEIAPLIAAEVGPAAAPARKGAVKKAVTK